MKKFVLLVITLLVVACASSQTENKSTNELDAENRKLLPILKLAVIYPSNAVEERISGRVLLQFSVNEKGLTQDILVLEHSPSDIFDQAAIENVEKYRYNPQRVANKRVSTKDLTCEFLFDITYYDTYSDNEKYKAVLRKCTI